MESREKDLGTINNYRAHTDGGLFAIATGIYLGLRAIAESLKKN